MSQDGREEVIAYATNSNMDTEEGPTLDTGYTLMPPRPSVDLEKLERDEDEVWFWQKKMPHAEFRKASNRVKMHFPRQGHVGKAMADQWACFADGSNFTDTSLGFVVDMFPQVVEPLLEKTQGPFWYPTLLLNIDIKKALPPEGVKWLVVRVQIKKVKNGRIDLDVHVYDEEGDLVALSHHVGFIMSASRNLAERRKSIDTKL
jgi:hypothetical protein